MQERDTDSREDGRDPESPPMDGSDVVEGPVGSARLREPQDVEAEGEALPGLPELELDDAGERTREETKNG